MDAIGNLPVRTDAYINGAWVSTKLRKDVVNPATGEVIASVAQCGAEETRRAIESAQKAFQTFKAMPAPERSVLLKRFFAAMMTHKAELAELLTREQGKPLKEAEREIAYGADYIEWYAEEARRIYGETIPASQANKRITILKEPVGVCAAITPWNFPNAMIARKLAPALAAGCTFIVKPAPETPLSALALGYLAEISGLPPGVLNVIPGDAATVTAELMASHDVRKLSFTGSTAVGKLLIQQSAETVKKVTMELGGNAPFLVFDDCDLDKTVQEAMFAKFRNAGQTCICANRFLVQTGVVEQFQSRLVESCRKLKVGDGLKAGSDIGAMISRKAVEKVRKLLEDAVKKGATLLLGAIPSPEDRFIPPIIVTKVTSSMQILNEEIFGPVVTILPFAKEEEAITIANGTNSGLASYLFTRDLSRAHRVAEALQFGMVGINDSGISTVQAPFGGIKESGFGREGGHHGIEEYLTVKYISMNIDKSQG